MIELKDFLIHELFPKNMQTNHLQALSFACNKMIHLLLSCSEQTMIFTNVDSLNDDGLDLLASMLHAPYYKSAFNLDRKRELVKNAVRYRNYGGKNISIEEILSLFYGEIQVEEWYEYDGEPYHFRLVSKDKVLTEDVVRECLRIINMLKRVTAVYDGIRFEKDIDMSEYGGVFLHVCDYINLKQREE